MTKETRLILVGTISGAHGIKGNVIIKSYTESTNNITKLPILDQNHNSIKLKKIKINSKNELICQVSNCSDRNQAESLKGTKLYCLRESLPELSEEEFYIEDLKGLKVLDESDNFIGTITEIANYGAGDIVEIKFNDNRVEMFPFIDLLFPTITKDHIIFCYNKK